jgi:hypothetical protein
VKAAALIDGEASVAQVEALTPRAFVSKKRNLESRLAELFEHFNELIRRIPRMAIGRCGGERHHARQ